ncbi:enoyl-CoA hydratase [Microlunatus parietis]|uniref:Enoyl-CoA hydratase/carnithine racemase n=1 Tax=Microlunatus parietis TaxID=682979 RepID=A0A7Y9I3Z4_9ACTN|nr:enoyl-CoA hydratase [Microlunatus parietis]NYE69747.1 enoyl-CoA hydratase/carnithine racemase [Microlunatus parietis]
MKGRVWLERSGPVGTIRLSHPGRRNALTLAMYDELAACCAEVAGSAELRVVIIRGVDGAFAAGTDIGEFTGFTGADDGVGYERRTGDVLRRLAAIDVPVIAAVDGPAVGGGLAIAASADLIIASDRSRFGVPIARTLGNCVPAAVLARLRERLGAGPALALLITADLITADRAHQLGLVHQVLPAADFDAGIDRLAERVAASAPLSLAAIKTLDRRLAAAASANPMPVDDEDLIRACYGSRDFAEGVRAFLDHRTPVWEGR